VVTGVYKLKFVILALACIISLIMVSEKENISLYRRKY